MERERICNEDFSSVVAEYKANGVVVVPSVLTPEEVQACRDGLHQNLLERGIDYYQLRNSPESLANLKQFQSHQSGGLPFYYCAWQMQYCMGNLRVFEATKSIWEATWAKGIQGFVNIANCRFSSHRLRLWKSLCSIRFVAWLCFPRQLWCQLPPPHRMGHIETGSPMLQGILIGSDLIMTWFIS